MLIFSVFLLSSLVLSDTSTKLFCADKSCLNTSLNSRIINGFASERNFRPFQVALYSRVDVNGQLGFCGGVLVDSQWVLTAAHCCYHHGELVDHVQAVLGAYSLFDRFENGRRVIQVSDIVVHPEWDAETVSNDIALLKLQNVAQFSDTIGTVRLPYLNISSFNFAGQAATVSGWGIAAEGVSFISPTLRDRTVTVVNDDLCNARYFNQLRDTTICGIHPTAGTCKGDNGGPMTLFYTGTEETILVGIVSFVGANGCSAGIPSVFTRVTQFLPWINQVTGIELL